MYLALCSQDTFWFSSELYEQYFEEYKTFIELAQDAPQLDFLTNTKCLEIWLNYLGQERYFEEKMLGDGVDKSWWNIAFKSIESVKPELKLLPKNKDGSITKKNKSKDIATPSLWDN
jgi:hypothetical protein